MTTFLPSSARQRESFIELLTQLNDNNSQLDLDKADSCHLLTNVRNKLT